MTVPSDKSGMGVPPMDSDARAGWGPQTRNNAFGSPCPCHDLAAGARRELLEDILPFWRRYGVDERRGGFIGQMSNDLRVQDEASKGLILNARLLWTFSAAYAYTQDERDRTLARRAYDYLIRYFLDREQGGCFWELGPDGTVRDDKKKVYGEAFCIYALAEYYRVFQEPSALEEAIRLFDLIETHARDRQHGGYFEVLSRDWQPCADMRLSDKDMNEKKSMNNHLHVLEGYTNLLRVLAWRGRPGLASRGRPALVMEEEEQGQDALATEEQGQDALATEDQGQDALATEEQGRDALAASLRDLIGLFQRHILNAEGTHLQHFFDEAWAPKSDSYTFGHDIEGSWLLCEAAEVLNRVSSWRGRPDLASRGRHALVVEREEQGQDALATKEQGQDTLATKEQGQDTLATKEQGQDALATEDQGRDALATDLPAQVQGMAIRMARAVLAEGLDKDGGLFYEGRAGRIVNPNKEWWPQAEAVVGFYNTWQLTGDNAFRAAAERCWRFIQERVVDHAHGEWFWCIRPDGTSDPAQPKVSFWKGPYHNGRCCLEIIRRTKGGTNY